MIREMILPLWRDTALCQDIVRLIAARASRTFVFRAGFTPRRLLLRRFYHPR